MARRSGLISVLNGMARESARTKRLAEVSFKRQQRDLARASRHAERMRVLQTKEEKQQHIEEQMTEVDELNEDMKEQINELKTILEHTLSVNDTILFDSLLIKEDFPAFAIPKELLPTSPPARDTFFANVTPPSWLARLIPGSQDKYQKQLQQATLKYQEAKSEHTVLENNKKAKIEALKHEHETKRAAFELKTKQRSEEVREFEGVYRNGDQAAIITYSSMVLERSEYPNGFPQEYKIAYLPDSKELVIEYDFPASSVIPAVAEYRYIKARDAIEEKPRKAAEIKELYKDVVAAITLRTIHEVLEADQSERIDVVVFNGYVETVDPSTGKGIRPCLLSVRTTKVRFGELDLRRIDKESCLRNLGAQVSPRPSELIAVKPVIEFDMVDKRFVEQGDVLSDLDSRPNLMDLNPFEFENLVTNLFGKMGLDAKLTRSSKDGGVDAVAFDSRPILGGKVVIQAKRYRNTVGVSAVRDLYGTMMNEGANKGILVTTSSYGPDAYDFAKDKPIELVDGGGLLYLLEQVGTNARIVFPTE